MVEFALVAPLFFFMVFGIIEFGIMMFDVTTTRFAAGEAARVEAQVGQGSKPCTAVEGCPTIYNGANARTTCEADCQAIVAAHATALGGIKLEQINYVDVQQITACTGTGTPISSCASSGTFVPTSSTSCERYNWDGSRYTGSAGSCPADANPVTCPVASGYPAACRNVRAGQMDYLQVNINFTYNWITGMFQAIARPPTLESKFIVRLEPQRF